MLLACCATDVDRPWGYTRRGTFHYASVVIVSACCVGHGLVTPDELMFIFAVVFFVLCIVWLLQIFVVMDLCCNFSPMQAHAESFLMSIMWTSIIL